jgi:hypothetical protein
MGKNNTLFTRDMQEQNTLMFSYIAGDNVKLLYSAFIDSFLIASFYNLNALRFVMSIRSQPINVMLFLIADLKPRKYTGFFSVQSDP